MSSNQKKTVLSNGLCVLNVKKKTNELVLLSLTDFNNTERFLFDKTEKKFKSNKDLKLKPTDFDLIDSCIKSYESNPPAIKELNDSNTEA